MLLPPATKLGQGYVFTGVCDSVHRGGEYLTRYPPPGARYTPQTRYTPPGTRYTPQDQVHPPHRPGTPQTRYTPPGPGRYGLRAGGTHPTGMHSCCFQFLTKGD